MPTKRNPKETKEEYHKRLNEEQQILVIKLKGKLIWNSTELGTYVKPKDETPEAKNAHSNS